MEVEGKVENKPSPSGAANVVKEPVRPTTVPSGAAAVSEPVQNGATGGEPSTSVNSSWEKEIPEVHSRELLINKLLLS